MDRYEFLTTDCENQFSSVKLPLDENFSSIQNFRVLRPVVSGILQTDLAETGKLESTKATESSRTVR